MHFRLLVLDLDMPDDGTDGFEILKMVRTELPHLQVLVISGYLRGALLEAAECLGARLSLYKDSAPRLLLESTRKLLGE
jgi:DNA-binding NarL/FixJ family response regulator